MTQSEFSAIMTPASDGIEGAVRAFVARDYTKASRQLDDVECGLRLLREWIETARRD